MGLGISAVGLAPMIAAFGIGFGVLAVWMRLNMHRLP
jgi:hypothetical protein